MNATAKIITAFALATALSACDDTVDMKRDAGTPMTVDIKNVEVKVYRNESHVAQDPRCGVEYVGGGIIYNTCLVVDPVLDRTETLDLRVKFPAGSELSGDQTETIHASFTNDYDHPELPFGTVDAHISSSHHRYDEAALKGIKVTYGALNEIDVQLK